MAEELFYGVRLIRFFVCLFVCLVEPTRKI
jgi:hypothetical protein